jgi:hypothetical protein
VRVALFSDEETLDLSIAPIGNPPLTACPMRARSTEGDKKIDPFREPTSSPRRNQRA